MQPDGKIIVIGDFFINGSIYYIVRLNSNGTIDQSFNNPSLAVSNPLYCVALQTNGEILIGGNFTNVDSIVNNNYLARLTTNGTLDTTFAVNFGRLPFTGAGVTTVALQPDGKVVVGGYFTNYGSVLLNGVTRLNSNGTRDTSFTSAIGVASGNSPQVVAIQPDGKILLAGLLNTGSGNVNEIVRLTTTGSKDTSFFAETVQESANGSGGIYCLALQASGEIVIGGWFTNIVAQGLLTTSPTCSNLGRIASNGTPETSANFNSLSIGGTTGNYVYSLANAQNGDIVVGGQFSTVGSASHSGIARLTNNIVQETLISSTTTIQWMRTNSAPEITQASFGEFNFANGQWVTLGTGTRIFGGWQLAGLNLPTGAYIRAQGTTIGGESAASSGIDEELIAVGEPSVSPFVEAISATNISATTAVLNGLVNSFDTPATVSFYYGTNASFGYGVSAMPSVVESSITTPESANIANLVPGTTYYFEIEAVTNLGRTYQNFDSTTGSFRTLGTNAFLSGLTLGAATLSPPFSSTNGSYSANVPYGVSNLTITAFAVDGNATYSVHPGAFTNSGVTIGPVALSVGLNQIQIYCLSQDLNYERGYTVAITRAALAGIPTLTSAKINGMGQFTLTFSGTSSANYSVYAATNLLIPSTNWTDLGPANPSTNAVFQYIDSQTTNFAARFYQIRSP